MTLQDSRSEEYKIQSSIISPNMKRLLLTGGSGLFGRAFINLAKNSYELYATYNQSPLNFENALQLDITDAKQVKKVIEKIEPDVILHSAAFTHVDKCEIEKKKAYETNTKATEKMSKIADKINAKLIYISTKIVMRWYHLLIFSVIGFGIYIGLLVLLREFKKDDLSFFLEIVNPKGMLRYIVNEIKR